MGLKDLVNDVAFVEDAGVGGFEVFAEAEVVQLALEGEGVHGGEDEAADAEGGAPFELFAGVGQDGDGGEGGVESGAEMGFEFFEWDLREEFGVKLTVGEAEGAAESFAIERRDFIFFEHGISGFKDGAEVVNKGAGPVEDEIAEHE